MIHNKLKKFFYSHLLHRLPESDDEKYLYLISFVACGFSASMHLFFLIFYYVINDLTLFFFCVFGLLTDVLLFWMVGRRRYLLFGVSLSAVVITYVLNSTLYIGTDNLIIVYLLVTFIMQLIIPYASVRVRSLVIFALWASMMAVIMIGYYVTPLRNIGKEVNTILGIFNIHLAFFGILIQLSIGNIIRGVIEKFNLEKLNISTHEANTDPMTGLFNRRYADKFFKRLSSDQRKQVWCVAMLDIDELKPLNDTYGHQAGDDILISVSNFISESLRKSDLVFRWGGDEFLLLLKDVDVSTAFAILEKLRYKLESQAFKTHGKTFKITVTIGVCPLNIYDIEQSIDTCDHLMYRGKISGKNVVVM